MANRFKNIPLDFVCLGLTVLALIFHCVGFFAGPWWTHEWQVGHSEFGMMTLRICQISCIEKTVLDLEGGTEWILTVRVFEVFGLIFVLLALLLAILAITVRTRPIHTAIVYMHGAAALFILVGVFVYLGFHSNLNEGLDGKGSIEYPMALCLLGGIVCIVTSVVSGIALRKHLLTWSEYDDFEEE